MENNIGIGYRMTITTSTRKNVNERSLDVISNLDLYVSAIGCQFLRRDKKIFFDSVKSRLNSVSVDNGEEFTIATSESLSLSSRSVIACKHARMQARTQAYEL